MAKKKSDTSGLSGIIKNVPREIDIKGQPHMLAWITPKEGKTLKDLGGAGKPGPMGIPAYYGEDPGFDGGGGGSAQDDPGGREDTSAGDTSTSDAETDDPDTRGDVSDSYRGSVGTGFGSYKGGAYEGDDDRSGRSYADTSYAFQGYGGPRDIGGATQAQLDELAKRDSWLSRKILDEREKGNVYGYSVNPETGKIVGISHKDTTGIGGLMTKIGSVVGLDDLMLMDRVYTGDSRFDPFNVGGGRDDGGTEDVVVSVTDAVEATPETPSDYYLRGIGTGTIDMTDAAKRQAYLEGLIGQTPSPIGATYDPTARSYTIPGGSKKQKTRLRGLDIFKPVNI